jgi:tetratricopeptide (TPR) repeat protein
MKASGRAAMGFFVLGLTLVGRGRDASAQSLENLVQRGVQALKANDFAQAERIFSVAVKESPSAANFNYLAVSEAGAGKLGLAITHFRRSIELGNESSSVHYSLGLAYLQQHQVASGLGELQLAVSLDPKLKPARYALAVALIDAGRPGEAIPHLMQLTKQFPSDAEAWANLARAQFEKKDENAAILTVNRAAEAMPANVRLIVTLAALCAGHHQIQKARGLLEDANELAPGDPDIELVLAKVSLRAGEPIELQAVIKDVPDDHGAPGEVPLLKGIALALTGKPEEATAEFSSAVAADPNNARYLIAQAWDYQLQNRHNDALSVLMKARKLDPANPAIPHRMAVSYFFLHQYERTENACQEALHLDSLHDPSYLLLGVSRLELGDLQTAQRAISQAITLKPTVALYHRELGVALFRNGGLAESKKELDRALTLDPKAARTYFWRAQLLASEGERKQAITDLRSALTLQPSLMDAYPELARLYSAEGRPEEASLVLAKQKELKAEASADDLDHFLYQLADPLP